MANGKKLYRSNESKMISGLCGGIGEYFGIDPTWLRLAWVLISMFTFVITGVIAYILATIIVPRDPGYIDV